MKKPASLLGALTLLAGCAQPGGLAPAGTTDRAPAPQLAAAPHIAMARYHTESLAEATDVIVRYKAGHSHTGSREGVSAVSHQLERAFTFHAANASDRQKLLDQARQDPDVEFAEPDHRWHVSSTPNDPYLSYQWDVPKMQLSQAWNLSQGASAVVVADVDTGVNYNHPDLAGQVIKGYNFAYGTNDPLDDDGHGTHTAGTIAADMNNGLGIAGIAPGCKILAIKVMDSTGSGSTANIANGILYAVKNGAKVINLSLGGPDDSQTLHAAIQQAVNAGVVVVAAAGNDGTSTPSYPAAYPEVISVGASDKNDARASYSNYGSWVSIAAPGSNILSTYKDGYAYMDGTSMATPHVVGVAALLRSLHPTWSVVQIRQALVGSGDPVSGFESNPAVRRLNAFAALQSTAGTAPAATPSPAATPTPAPTPRATPTPPPVSTSGPIITGLRASSLTLSSALLAWSTNVAADGQIVFDSLGWTSQVFPTLTTAHSVTISGLARGTYYTYHVVSRDAAGHSTVSPTNGFRTAYQ